jgi:acylpyruvate hydrolase
LRFATYRLASRHGLAVADKAGTYRGLLTEHASYPGTLESLVAKGEVALRAAAETLVRTGEAVDLGVVKLEQPLAAHGKIICVGLNYADHASEASMKAPDYPTLFARFPSSLIAHNEPIVRPRVSDKLDYEGALHPRVPAQAGTQGRAQRRRFPTGFLHARE